MLAIVIHLHQAVPVKGSEGEHHRQRLAGSQAGVVGFVKRMKPWGACVRSNAGQSCMIRAVPLFRLSDFLFYLANSASLLLLNLLENFIYFR